MKESYQIHFLRRKAERRLLEKFIYMELEVEITSLVQNFTIIKKKLII
jgi:hypothetical protein